MLTRALVVRPTMGSVMVHVAPGLSQLRAYRPDWLRGDLVAGLTLAAYLVPAALGDAALAGLPPEAGLYACVFGGLVFWLFCSSKHTVVTPTSALAVLVGASLGDLAGGDAGRFAALAAATTLMVALIFLVGWVVSAGNLANFISDSVLIGFRGGLAAFLVSTQLPHFLGIEGTKGEFWARLVHLAAKLGAIHGPSFAIGGAGLAAIVAGKYFFPHRPVALGVVIAGILATWWLNLGEAGVALLGPLPSALPSFARPEVDVADLKALLPLALACGLMGAIETMAIGRGYAHTYRYPFDADRELLGLAASNLLAGLGRGLPISGGTSQSAVNEANGAHTPLSGVIASAAILAATLWLAAPLQYLPQPLVAAVVLSAAGGLFSGAAFRHLWRADRGEFTVAACTLLGVLLLGVLEGLLIGAVFSLVRLLHRGAQPHVAFLGRIPGTRRFSDLDRDPDNEIIPGAVLFRVEASLLYFNADHVRAAVLKRLQRPGKVSLVICDLSSSPLMDLAGAQMLAGLQADLATSGIGFRIVEPGAPVLTRLRTEGLAPKMSHPHRVTSLADAVEEFLHR